MMLTPRQLGQIMQIVEPFATPDYCITGSTKYLLLTLLPLSEDTVRQLAVFEPFVVVELMTKKYRLVIYFEA